MKLLKTLSEKIEKLKWNKIANEPFNYAYFEDWRTKTEDEFIEEYMKENNIKHRESVYVVYQVNDRKDVEDLNKMFPGKV